MNIVISCQPSNPLEYLATCGVFDLTARIDPCATGCWSPTAFHLIASVSEDALVAMICDTLCEPDRWTPIRPVPTGEATSFSVSFTPRDMPAFDVTLDWWLETAELDGAIDSNTAWKMYAGRQTVERLLLLEHTDVAKRGMIHQCAQVQAKGNLSATFTQLLAFTLPLTSRFGYDYRSSRTAINAGWSADELQVPVATAIFAELLSLFGASSFFPARCGRAGRPDSTRGWEADNNGTPPGFRYTLWQRPLPVSLARVAAFSGDGISLIAARDMRGQYKTLNQAKPS